MAGEVGYPSQVAPIFAEYATKCEVWRCPDEKRYPSDLPIPDAFHRLLPLIGLIGNSICPNLSFGCVEGIRNTRCPSNPIRYTALSFSDVDRPLERLIVAHIIFLKIFFHIDVNNPFFIARDYSFQKWIIFVAFEQRIADGNTIH